MSLSFVWQIRWVSIITAPNPLIINDIRQIGESIKSINTTLNARVFSIINNTITIQDILTNFFIIYCFNIVT